MRAMCPPESSTVAASAVAARDQNVFYFARNGVQPRRPLRDRRRRGPRPAGARGRRPPPHLRTARRARQPLRPSSPRPRRRAGRQGRHLLLGPRRVGRGDARHVQGPRRPDQRQLPLPIITADQRLAEPRGIKGCCSASPGSARPACSGRSTPRPRCSSTSRPAISRSRAGRATRSGRAPGPNAATSPSSSAGRTRRCATNSPTARRITMRSARGSAIPRCSTATRPSSSTRSPWPAGSASSGARASPRRRRRRPASRTCVAPTGCTAAR